MGDYTVARREDAAVRLERWRVAAITTPAFCAASFRWPGGVWAGRMPPIS